MKYVVMEVELSETSRLEVPFIFPDVLVHKSIAAQMQHALYREYPNCRNVRCISAGSVSSIDMDVTCCDKSSTLNLSHRAEDTELIRMCDYGSMIKC